MFSKTDKTSFANIVMDIIAVLVKFALVLISNFRMSFCLFIELYIYTCRLTIAVCSLFAALLDDLNSYRTAVSEVAESLIKFIVRPGAFVCYSFR